MYVYMYVYTQECMHASMYICMYIHTYAYMTRFAKTRHNDTFLEIQIFASACSIYPKLSSVMISMLYCKQFLRNKARQQKKQCISLVVLQAFLRQLILCVFYYTIITYGYFYVGSWDKDHSTQHEMAISIMYRFFKNIRANY